MLTLMVTYMAKSGCREQFVRRIVEEGVLTAIRGEDGCVRYDYYFSAQNADEVLLVETWQSEEKQRIHMTQPHMAALSRIKETYVDSVQVVRIREESYAL